MARKLKKQQKKLDARIRKARNHPHYRFKEKLPGSMNPKKA